MRVFGLALVSATVMLSVLATPAMAAGEGGSAVCSNTAQVETAPGTAASMFQSSLPSGTTLGAGSEEDILAAFKDSMDKNPAAIGDIAALIAVARPDLLDGLTNAVRESCSANANAIIAKIQEAAANPTADQLAAIATTDGIAPAAGPEADAEPDGSEG